MSFKIFENEMPDIYSLAYHAERVMETDHIIALNHLKEITWTLERALFLLKPIK
ncbi:hypothetical protein [Paenibacillus sp. An7]|uniref:hypothetical protein n=1 Tax=Paenibacillus sp. An7 TaxID=2689577 RepID=UPI001359FD2E|nr:hypothetical protein [Paenibacillus sp. An7]